MDILNYYEHSDEKVYFNHVKKINQSQSEYTPHSHDAFEIIFVKSESLVYTVGGRRYKVMKNGLIFTRPFDIHCISFESGNDYERYDLLFDTSLMPDYILKKIPRDLHTVSFNNNKGIVSIFEKMDYYCEKLKGDALGLVLSNLIQEIIINISLEAEDSADEVYSSANSLVSDAINYIDNNICTVSSVEEICRELYITKSHLHHLFAKHLKTTPKKYITSKRLALAQREIFMGARPTEVYERCGFSEYSTFYRAYCSFFGRPPSIKPRQDNILITHDNTPRKTP